jgi:hypothetical protein
MAQAIEAEVAALLSPSAFIRPPAPGTIRPARGRRAQGVGFPVGGVIGA